MSRSDRYIHEFVDAFPDSLTGGVLYVSVEFGNTAHRCMCGCGQEVYARLSPRDWSMIFDGETVSLRPSIGNWSFDCQSHYWLERGRVSWAGQFSKKEIDQVRRADEVAKTSLYGQMSDAEPSIPARPAGTIARFLSWLFR